MGVRSGGSRVGELSFRVFDRTLHPDWFRTREFKRIEQVGWEADLRIIDGGHAVIFRSGSIRLAEILTGPETVLPEAGVVFQSHLRRERSAVLRPGGGIEYQNCLEVERVDLEIFRHLCANLHWVHQLHAVDKKSHFGMADYQHSVALGNAYVEPLKTKDAIVKTLETDGEAFAHWLEHLSDATLAEVVTFPPPLQPSQKTRFEMLLGVKEHEMHHRAQLMLIERLLGIVPHLTRQRQAAPAPAAANPAVSLILQNSQDFDKSGPIPGSDATSLCALSKIVLHRYVAHPDRSCELTPGAQRNEPWQIVVNGAVCGLPSGAATTITYTFTSPLVLTSNQSQWLGLDFNLNNAITSSTTTGVAINFSSTWRT